MPYNWNEIDWADMRAKISDNFTVHEALWLPSWRVYHQPNDAQKQEIVNTAVAMEKVRGLFSARINVHCWMRPAKVNAPGSEYHGKNYNKFVGGATASAHILGKAVDFHVDDYEGEAGCARARQVILPNLELFNIRMEDKAGGWIHIDTQAPIVKRFFKP